jgi:hypothetical protein
LSAGPPGGALAEKGVHAFLAIRSEEVTGDRVPGDVVGRSALIFATPGVTIGRGTWQRTKRIVSEGGLALGP